MWPGAYTTSNKRIAPQKGPDQEISAKALKNSLKFAPRENNLLYDS